jgi:hypothetical protein
MNPNRTKPAPSPGGYFFVAGTVRGVEHFIHPARFTSATEAAVVLRAVSGDEEVRGLPIQGPFPSRREAWNAFDTATAR